MDNFLVAAISGAAISVGIHVCERILKSWTAEQTGAPAPKSKFPLEGRSWVPNQYGQKLYIKARGVKGVKASWDWAKAEWACLDLSWPQIVAICPEVADEINAYLAAQKFRQEAEKEADRL